MSTFEKAVGYVIENEVGNDQQGAFSNDPVDRGGATKWGITQAVAERHGFDVRTLTREQAVGIYKADYWRFDGIDDQRVATKLLDMCVNMGPRTAIRIAQREAVMSAIDGVFGPDTSKAINVAGPGFMERLVIASVRRYARIVANDPTQARFIVDWTDRALKVPA